MSEITHPIKGDLYKPRRDYEFLKTNFRYITTKVVKDSYVIICLRISKPNNNKTNISKSTLKYHNRYDVEFCEHLGNVKNVKIKESRVIIND